MQSKVLRGKHLLEINDNKKKDDIEKESFNLPIGHNVIINSVNKNNSDQIFIPGIGSCIVPIIYDKNQKIAGLSHILLSTSKKGSIVTYPHKFADLSIKHLVKELKKHGAENLEAVIVGGAQIFRVEDNNIGQKNIKIVKKELKKLKINIIKEEIGGNKGRIFIFDAKNFSISVKISGSDDYKIIKLTDN